MRFCLMLSAAALAYNSECCPTVTVKGQDGNPLRINQSDYEADPTAWELLDEAVLAVAQAPVEQTVAPVVPQMVVTKEGRGDSARWFVTDSNKAKIVGVEGIDEAGYAAEADAWAAVMAKSAPAA